MHGLWLWRLLKVCNPFGYDTSIEKQRAWTYAADNLQSLNA
jgi:hypothetical protein